MALRLRLPHRLPARFLPWAIACLLLTVGILTTIADLTHRPDQETLTANSNGQRVIVDPVTGAVSGLQGAGKEEAFEVGNAEESAHDTPGEPTDDPSATPEATAEHPPAGAVPATTDSILPDSAPALRTEAEALPLPAIESSNESLVKPPAPEITELVKNGAPLPKRGDKDASTSKLYAKRFSRNEKTAYISIVLTDVGFNHATLAQVVKLPRGFTVALSPYALELPEQIALLRGAGFETWGMLPVMSDRYPQDDPGPMGLIGGMPADTQMERLHQVMAATLGAVGYVLPPNESLSAMPDFTAILKEIDARGLLVLSTAPGRAVEKLTSDAAQARIILRADMVLDSTSSAAFIQSKLAGLKTLAKKQGNLIVVATARPQTLALLAEWAKTPLGNGIALAPLSAMLAPPPAAPEAPKDDAAESSHDAPEKKSGGHGGGH